MKKKTMKSIGLIAAAVMSVSFVSADITDLLSVEAVSSTASFSKASYCSVKAKYVKGKLTISWDKYSGAKYYLVYKKTGDGEYKQLKKTYTTSCIDMNIKKDTAYIYKVVAVNGKNKSEDSEFIHLTVDSEKNGKVEIYDEPTDIGARKKTQNNDYIDYDYECYEEADCDEVGAGCEDWDDVPVVEEESFIDAEIPDTDIPYYYNGNDDITPGTLTAGRLNDKLDYKNYIKTASSDEWKYYADEWGLPIENRLIVTVTDGTKVVSNAKVYALSDDGKTVFTAVTNNRGEAYVYPTSKDVKIASVKVVSADKKQTAVADSGFEKGFVNVELGKTADITRKLDLMFMIDTTGSMGDELRYLQTEIDDVIGRVSKDNDNIRIRTSVNFYRDEGDEYVVRAFSFRDSVDTVKRSLSEQYANGGGDYPEAVHTALDVAVNKHVWENTSTKLLFMVLDAPAHDDEKVIEEYNKRILEAAEKGIRIIPIVSSGTDTETEYLMRSTALITGGTYLFLTDDSGVGLSHKTPDNSQYEVTKLNDLIVSVIDEYLEYPIS